MTDSDQLPSNSDDFTRPGSAEFEGSTSRIHYTRRLQWALVACCLLGAAGCSLGGQTGEGSSPSGLVTEGDAEEFANDEETPIGFSAEDVIALTKASESDFAALWPATFTRGGRALPGESSDAQVSFSVVAKGTKSEFVPLEVSYTEGVFGVLAVPVTVSMTLRGTDEAELHVEAEGELWAASPHFTRLKAEVTASDVVGDDAFVLAEGERISGYELDAHWSALGGAGRLVRNVERDADDAQDVDSDAPRRTVIWRALPFAVWPATNDCNQYEHPLPLDSELPGLKPTQMVAPFNTEGEVRWLDGNRSALVIGATPSRNNACIGLGELGSEVPHGVYVRLPAKLAATSEDGRWDATYSSELTLLLSHTAEASPVGYSVRESVTSQTVLSEDLGIFGVEVPEGSHVQFRLELEAADSNSLAGSLVLQDYGPPSPNASPSDFLERGFISAIAAETGSSD